MKVPIEAKCPACGAREEFEFEIEEGQEKIMQWLCPNCDLIWATTIKGEKKPEKEFNLTRIKGVKSFK